MIGGVGYVPQKNSFNPLFPATVREVVLSGLYNRNKLFKRVTKADQLKCDEALHAMKIEDLAAKRIGQLSGGQQQRAFLARALINNPALLILDEPTVGIDSETQEGFFHLIKHMHQHHNITFLLVSHDMEMIRSYLGQEPKRECGKIKLYVKHSHDLEDCVETNLTHSLKELRHSMERESRRLELEIITSEFFQRALMGGILIGITAPLMGLFLVLRRLSMIGDTLAHVSIAGVALGFLIGVYPVAVGLLFALGAYLCY